jgi:uncharacterized membrane protein
LAPESFYHKFLSVTPEQCIKESLNKCTSGLIFGALPHEILGTLLNNVMDLMPYESRMLMTSDMGKKILEDKKGLKI